ncbi:apolipoprotein D-like [Malaya genurostris]|uniref:apolipoprotein D-like n=1 Tax=Malaya genurostris TaxID=325434 RepID=UPI0026F3A8B3|nr:apolipoprotein D-like [Malaya genurostris]
MPRSVITTALLLLGPVSMVTAVIYEKNCLHFDEAYNFREDRYTGKWYEVRRLADPEVSEQLDCVQEKYTRSSNMLDFDIIRSIQKTAAGDPIYTTGVASPRTYENSKVPQFYLRYNTTSPADPDIQVDIVQTDYLNFAIEYSCNSINSTTVSESARVLSRRRSMPKHAVDIINKFVVANFKHPQHKWRVTEQSDGFCKPTIIINSGTSGGTRHGPAWQSIAILFVILAMSILRSELK